MDEARKEYLNGLCDEYGIPMDIVYTMAELLGEEEDYDGLISSLEDYND